jgi:hypothetical protein
MTNQRQKPTAIKALLFATLLLASVWAWAGQVAGTVVHLSGPLMARKADGTVKVLALKSEVESGDTLVSEKNTYAQIKFIDNSEITLRPGTTFRIENFAYEAGKPEADSAAFSLVKGGLRSITGLLGKRNKEKFSLKTPSATIGIRGTTFVAQWVAPSDLSPQAMQEMTKNMSRAELAALLARMTGQNTPAAPPAATFSDVPGTGFANGAVAAAEAAGIIVKGAGTPPPSGPQPSREELGQQLMAMAAQNMSAGRAPAQGSGTPSAPALPPGLHLQVTDGAIIVVNNGGSLGFQAGQFGYVPNVNQPPVIVPSNPGLQFVPPPSFSGSTPGGPLASNGAQDKGAVDCVVR